MLADLQPAFLSGPVQVWDLATRQEIFTLPNAHGGQEVRTVSWSPDGRLLATAGWMRAVRLWNVETKENILSFLEHSNVSRLGSLESGWPADRLQGLVSGGVLIWDAPTGKVMSQAAMSRRYKRGQAIRRELESQRTQAGSRKRRWDRHGVGCNTADAKFMHSRATRPLSDPCTGVPMDGDWFPELRTEPSGSGMRKAVANCSCCLILPTSSRWSPGVRQAG